MKGSMKNPWSEDDVENFMEPSSFIKRFIAFIIVLKIAVGLGISYVIYLLLNHFGVLMAGVPL
jgi:hypothetical protein